MVKNYEILFYKHGYRIVQAYPVWIKDGLMVLVFVSDSII